MPELPEVECVRRTLEPGLLGRVVERVQLHRRDIVSGSSDPAALLEGARIIELQRRGKQIGVIAESGRAMVIQLGMTGQVLLESVSSPSPPTPTSHRLPGVARSPGLDHVHATWRLRPVPGQPGVLLFRDPRRFGGLTTLASLSDLQRRWAELGPDALTVSAAALQEGLRGSRRAIKAALLDQGVIAGVGNIYADEALFTAGIPPRMLASRVHPERLEVLADAIRDVLAQAIHAGGSTLRDYVDASGTPGGYALEHRVYGRGGEACVRCGNRLRSALVAQRTTVWCATCQRSNPQDSPQRD